MTLRLLWLEYLSRHPEGYRYTRLGQGSELRLGVDDALDDAEQVKGAAREAVDARYRHHVVGRESLHKLCASCGRSAVVLAEYLFAPDGF